MNILALATNGLTPACHENQHLFSAAALDYDPRDEMYTHLDLLGHTIMAAHKTAAEEAAVDVCFGCPLMLACEQMDTDYLADPHNPFISGVIGGRTEAERRARMNGTTPKKTTTAAPNPQIAPGGRGPRNQVDDDLVARLTLAGQTSDQIAEFIGCSARTVSRARARMGLNTTKNKTTTATSEDTSTLLGSTTATTLARAEAAARNAGRHTPATGTGTNRSVPATSTECTNPFNGGRPVTAPMEAVYNHLTNVGGSDHIDNLIAVGIPHVTPTEAIDWWTKHNTVTINGHKVLRSTKANTPTEDRIREGARAKVLNAISATARKGRYLDRDGDTYTFKPDAHAAWINRMNARVAA